MRVLIEAVGSPVWGPMLPWLHRAAESVTGADIDPMAWGLHVGDKGIVVPAYGRTHAWSALKRVCREERIDTVFPSVQEGLPGWASRKSRFARIGVRVAVSPERTIRICTDKWLTFLFLKKHGIPTPETSLRMKFGVIKPRVGRGGRGVVLRASRSARYTMRGMISQELLEGMEFSADVLCDGTPEPVCVVVRDRLAVESGVSVRGRVVADSEVEGLVRRIVSLSPFLGPVNVQGFRTRRGVFVTEINPRIAGGMSLSMAATGNWFRWMDSILDGRPVRRCGTRTGLVMLRYYKEVIVDEREISSCA